MKKKMFQESLALDTQPSSCYYARSVYDTLFIYLLFFKLIIFEIQTFLTSISLSAVATNGVVESGGAYFMIRQGAVTVY